MRHRGHKSLPRLEEYSVAVVFFAGSERCSAFRMERCRVGRFDVVALFGGFSF